MTSVDTLILGAGAAGMFCAATAGARGGSVLVLDHARAAGEKIRISGGGRCNFTNTGTVAERFLSANPHFAKSALARYSPWDFIDLVDRHGIAWHEKTLGQLFCDGSAKEIIAMLRAEMAAVGAHLWLSTEIVSVTRVETGFGVEVSREGARQTLACRHLVVATGGKSIPKMGATGLGYRLAAQFGLRVTDTRAGLVPLTFSGLVLDGLKALAGVSVPARVQAGGASFEEGMLFTHRGLSGPSILQASSYWEEGEAITLTLDPDTDHVAALAQRRQVDGKRAIATVLADLIPKRLAQDVVDRAGLSGTLGDQSDAALARLGEALHHWAVLPSGTEGYRTAEVTLGGVDTRDLDAKTLGARNVPCLYFIGEVVDVTGWLGGYNFQWAWASAHACGSAIAAQTTP